MSDSTVDAKLELKQASKDVKESENVAEKYSAMTVSKNSELTMGELSSVLSAVPTHKPVKKVRRRLLIFFCFYFRPMWSQQFSTVEHEWCRRAYAVAITREAWGS